MNTTLNFDEDLSELQLKAFNLFKEDRNLLILGEAGCGKSNIVKTIEKHITVNTSKTIYLCATTGVSAYNIGGMTIHSFMGMGTGEHDIDFLIKRVRKNKQARDRITMTNILVIDEISMLSAELFEKINIICQVIRRNNDFFGGIQVVFSGDLLQLLPVFKNALNKPMDTRFIIESPVFLKMFDKSNTIVLTENFRQKSDSSFINLLQRMRNGQTTEADIQLLNSRKIKTKGDIIQLVSSNKKAQIINQTNLVKIKEPEHIYNVQYIHEDNQNTQVFNLLINELESQLKTREMEKLVLKKGCRVMLLRNIDVKLGLTNGSIGTIIDFKMGLPEVRFDNDVVKLINTHQWDIEDPVNKVKVSAMQLPLMLAYSCTIHKTQGLTLENAILDLSDCFCEHQVYVALSRVRNLNGVYLKSFDQTKITVNKKMLGYLNKIS
jgi:ATP-dependent DNA helicase PIF1